MLKDVLNAFNTSSVVLKSLIDDFLSKKKLLRPIKISQTFKVFSNELKYDKHA